MKNIAVRRNFLPCQATSDRVKPISHRVEGRVEESQVSRQANRKGYAETDSLDTEEKEHENKQNVKPLISTPPSNIALSRHPRAVVYTTYERVV